MLSFAEKIGISSKKQFLKMQLDQQINNQKQLFKEKLDAIKDYRNKFLVGCFSGCYDSLLMWSHYADSHHGICIEFDISEKEEKTFYKIRYSDNRPSYNLSDSIKKMCQQLYVNGQFDQTDGFIIKLLSEPYITKSIDWAYEKEYRLIYTEKDIYNNNKILTINNDENDLIAYEMPKIKRIYTGVNFDFIKHNSIISLCQNKDIEVIKVTASDQKYQIMI